MARTTHRATADIFSDARKALGDRPSIPQDVRAHVDGVLRVVNNIIVAHVANPQRFEAPTNPDSVSARAQVAWNAAFHAAV
jgi:hypothetical protein